MTEPWWLGLPVWTWLVYAVVGLGVGLACCIKLLQDVPSNQAEAAMFVCLLLLCVVVWVWPAVVLAWFILRFIW